MKKNKIKIQYYKSLIGELLLGSYDDKLCIADMRYRKKRTTIDNRIQKGLKAEYVEEPSEVVTQTIKELEEYFRYERKEFTIPLLLVGTNFQKLVWQGLIDTPFGTTSSYLELSKRIGKEKSVRAVASANGANAIAILVPCHRIIGSNGDLVGYAGGLDVKKRLLEIERNLFSDYIESVDDGNSVILEGYNFPPNPPKRLNSPLYLLNPKPTKPHTNSLKISTISLFCKIDSDSILL